MNDRRYWFKKKIQETQTRSGYVTDETVNSIARKLNRSPSDITKLNSNENFFVPRKELVKLFLEVIEERDPRIYPQEEEIELKKAIGKYIGISPENILVENGSDQLINLTSRLFLEKDDEALSIIPTFSMYQKLVDFQGAHFIGVPLKEDFSIDLEQILKVKTEKTRILFLCSPNNPTANQFRLEEIRFLIEEFQTPVVIDEAYVEFAKYSVTKLVEKYENLIVFRTFSKAFGLAGVRLGYAVTNTEIAKAMLSAQLPYNVSALTLKLGMKLMENAEIARKATEKLKEERERFVKELRSITGITAFDSQTNFILFQTKRKSIEVFQKLIQDRILVKHIGEILHLKNCLRTTVGLPVMNNKLLKSLNWLCGKEN